MKNTNTDGYGAVVLAVAHDKYKNIQTDNNNKVVFDIKPILDDTGGRI